MMQIKNVLVPVDFSPTSRLAIDYGIFLGRRFRARLTLVNVVEAGPSLNYVFPTESTKIEKQHFDQAVRLLPALIAPEDQDDLDLRTIVKAGDIQEQILAAIHGENADIVVMGTHGRGFISRLFIGSVTQGLLRKVPVPVLTLSRVSNPVGFSRILFATDLSEASRKQFRFVLEMAKILNARVVVLHAVEQAALTVAGPEIVLATVADERFWEEARALLGELAADGAREGVKVESMLEGGNAAETIFRAVDTGAVDLIAITIPRKRLLERAMLGSTAERVIREAHVPVLSLPTHD
jgi:nucleotide-binding universal stress UspA family protein